MTKLLPLLCAATLLNISLLTQAQITFPINIHHGDTIETCAGFFVDSGGDTLTPYNPNENYSVTFTAASDNDEDAYLRFTFLFFDLGTGDFLDIYDGPDNQSPLIASGTGNDLLGEEIWSSGSSLHFRFTSSPSDTALGWWANIDCFTLCDAFYVDVNTPIGSFDFCPDVQSVTFTADAGYLGGNPDNFTGNVNYIWNFDGHIQEGATVTHNYDGPGAYPFRLTVTDLTNNCTLDTIITVRFGIIPTFENTAPSADTVCSGEVFTLAGSANITPWTGFPTVVDTLAFIGYEHPFTSTLTFEVFPDDAQIVFLDDFDRVCINIEHTDFGQLEFELECPNGTRVQLKEQSLGGAHLGEPVIFSNIPGVGYNYCFSTSPQYPLMSETSFQFHEYTDQAGDYHFNQPYLPAGTYTPLESLEAFIGCPLNGTWTLRAEDVVQGDAGHISGWSLFFNDDFYPDSLIFSTEIVDQRWFDQNGNEIGTNPVSTSIDTSEKDDFFFTYRVTDNFGCQWDTTVMVTALPLPVGEIVSELEIPICEGDSTVLRVVADLVGAEDAWKFQWMLEGEELEGRIFDTIMATQIATYMVRVTDTITGCFDFFDISITDQDCTIRVPNVFTPNNDGINDLFEVENLEHYPGSVMVIYNRHGKKVFEHNDYYGNWWDGANQPDGTYYYVLTYTRQGERRQTQGVITIIR